MNPLQLGYDFDDLLQIYSNCENTELVCTECPLYESGVCNSLMDLETNFIYKFGTTPGED